MKKMLLFALVLVIVPLAYSQQDANLSSGQDFRAGDVVHFNIHLDQAPAAENPAVLVSIGPKDLRSPGVQNVGLLKSGSGDCTVAVKIPEAAKPGTWVVRSVRLLVPPGPEVPLHYNAADFQVTAKDMNLPTSADVQISK